MPGNDARRQELGNPGYEIFIGALSVLSLVNVVLISLLKAPATQDVVRAVDVLLSVVFLLDFLARLRRAPEAGRGLSRRASTDPRTPSFDGRPRGGRTCPCRRDRRLTADG